MENNLLPILLLDNFFVFPSCSEFLNLENNENLRKILIESWKKHNGKVLVVSSKKPIDENKKKLNDYNKDDFFDYGTLVEIDTDFSKDTDPEIIFNSLREIKLTGIDRVKLTNLDKIDDNNFYYANYHIVREESDFFSDNQQKLKNSGEIIKKLTSIISGLNKKNFPSFFVFNSSDNISDLVDFFVQNNKSLIREFKQSIVREYKLENRLKIIFNLDKETREREKSIREKINKRIEKQQSLHMIKEQISVLQNEANEIEGIKNEKDSIIEKIKATPFPEHARDLLISEVETYYDKAGFYPQESNFLKVYLDLCFSLPWANNDNFDKKITFDSIKKTLDQNHYGLEKVKERIIEFFVVLYNIIDKTKNNKDKLNKSNKTGDILLLVGPPGVGKTSIASSIAKSLDRKFIKISVGGINDEADIKGHRRTYVASSPGRIINAMKKAGTLDPVILIDEIDKIGNARGHRGNPADALLEVLDSSENSAFIDSYLSIPYDLSNVIFVCTANSLEEIPSPLLDRMEIVRLSSYTYLEKIEIAKRYLIPKIFEKFVIDSEYNLTFTDEAISFIIKYYTRESGVRSLKRVIEKLSRKFLVKHFNEKISKFEFNEINIPDFLGEKYFNDYSMSQYLEVGVVNGLAYTDFGGDILNIEVVLFKGKGKIILTGTLGNVMKESANIAINYVKKNSDFFEIDQKDFLENDIHIHVPQGSIPKEGPSAGIAMTTAIISAFKNVKVPSSIAMTGEITLRGNVLPIGGLREKTIAAFSNGIKTVVIPEENKKKISEIPEEVLKDIEILFVKNYKEVWEIVSKRSNLEFEKNDEEFKRKKNSKD